jgi:hypothetical protein
MEVLSKASGKALYRGSSFQDVEAMARQPAAMM